MPATILLVDDSPTTLQMLKQVLTKANYSVITEIDSTHVLKRATETLPDLVILDVMMPQVSGFKIAQQLRKDDTTKHIPIIILTAMSGAKHAVDELDVKIDKLLAKPVHPRDLTSAVEALLP